ncbi:hypothetical protein SDC9_134939 [bioreactor metagenome]|uniref:Uncharacterized protein n=1 Tax=bioreactor metagenome TaxID=1076179 RepID=A0A645DEZ9_9ZZZZ|nr:CPC_1213 family protein [Oscillospiraceae bacterium]
MGSDNKQKSTKNNKKSDGKFHSKNIKHDPNAESARKVNTPDNKNAEIKK